MFRRLTWDAAVFWGCLILAGIAIALSGCVTTCTRDNGVETCTSWPV